MATNTFDRKIEITDPEVIKKLSNMAAEPMTKPLSDHPYTDTERKKAEKLLKQCKARSKK